MSGSPYWDTAKVNQRLIMVIKVLGYGLAKLYYICRLCSYQGIGSHPSSNSSNSIASLLGTWSSSILGML